MTRLESVMAELVGLFVDDGRLAVAVLAWLGGAWLFLPRLDLTPAWPPVILFVGLAGILVESVLRRAGQRP